MLDWRDIDREIKAGLSNEKPALDDARRYLDFYEGRFALHPTRSISTLVKHADHRRTSRIMRRIVQIMTGSLYKKPPTRQLAAGPEATEWLNRCYKRSGMAACWPKADALALICGTAAFQFIGNGDPATLVDIELWERDSFLYWHEPGRRKVIAAVATVDRYDNQSRLRLFTPERMRTYVTDKLGPTQTAGGQAWKFQREIPNPYGTLPFSFVHAEYPTTDFDTPGLGEFLSTLNHNINFIIDNLGDATRFSIYPIPLAKNVSAAWTPPERIEPGRFIRLAGAVGTAGNLGASMPELAFVEPPSGYVDVVWKDVNNYLDRCLEDIGIPAGTIRMTGDATSGVAMIIEQAPILSWAENRRLPFADYEASAARKAAEVGAAHLRDHGHRPPPFLDQTARDDGLGLRWSPLFVQLPGPERDRSDQQRVSEGYATKVQILQEREDLTRDQAIEHLRQVVKDNAELEALGIPPGLTVPPVAAPGGPPAGNQPAIDNSQE